MQTAVEAESGTADRPRAAESPLRLLAVREAICLFGLTVGREVGRGATYCFIHSWSIGSMQVQSVYYVRGEKQE